MNNFSEYIGLYEVINLKITQNDVLASAFTQTRKIAQLLQNLNTLNTSVIFLGNIGIRQKTLRIRGF